MTVTYKTGKTFVDLAKAIAAITGEAPTIRYTPTMAYKIGSYTVSESGDLEADDPNELAKIKEALVQKGFIEEHKNDATEVISVPANSANTSILSALLNAKQNLIKHALDVNDISFEVDGDTLRFPWFTRSLTEEEHHAYTTFIEKLCSLSTKLNYAYMGSTSTTNEKYTFRCFLVRLGFVGAEYKQDRKVLLSKLSGSSASKR